MKKAYLSQVLFGVGIHLLNVRFHHSFPLGLRRLLQISHKGLRLGNNVRTAN